MDPATGTISRTRASRSPISSPRLRFTPNSAPTSSRSRDNPNRAGLRALLAFLEQPIIDEVLSHELEAFAPGTVTDPDVLRKQLEQIRRRGWASSYEENNVGAWGLAAPILVGGAVVASIGFAAPAARHSDSTVRSLAKLVCEAARESEARLDSANMSGGARTEAVAKAR